MRHIRELANSKPESQTSNEIQTALKLSGCIVYSVEHGRRQQTAGVPDLIVFHPPTRQFTFAEIKTPRGTMSKPQQAFAANCRMARVPHRVWTSAAEALEWSGAK